MRPIEPLPVPADPFGVILADPALRFETRTAAGQHKSPQSKYRCMTVAEHVALRRDLGLDLVTARDCVLAMWTYGPILEQSLFIARAWGFKFATFFPWIKTTRSGGPVFGSGHIVRSATELVLICTRGTPRVRDHGVNGVVWQDGLEINVACLAPRGGHSEKPEDVATMLEAIFEGPYLELFARRKRPGWLCWGDQVGVFDGGSSSL